MCGNEGAPPLIVGSYPRVWERPIPIKRIHVNRHTLARNKKFGENAPAVGVEQSGRTKRYGHRVQIMVNGEVVASVIHSEERPMHCGARCWIETQAEVRVE